MSTMPDQNRRKIQWGFLGGDIEQGETRRAMCEIKVAIAFLELYSI
jgi:hypothetical protein